MRTAEQRIERAVMQLMKNSEFIAYTGIFAIGRRTVVDDHPTAATDGVNEKYGRAFVDKLNDAELRYLILHENIHKATRTLVTWKNLHDKDPWCANESADHWINLGLNATDASTTGWIKQPIPETSCADPRFTGMNTAQIFAILYDERKKNGGKGGSGDGQGQTLDHHDWDNANSMEPEEQREMEQQITQALEQGKKLEQAAGMDGAPGSAIDVGALLDPVVDWRAELSQFMRNNVKGGDWSTWSKPNRRYLPYRMYMPSAISESMREVVLAPDMSGSTWNMRDKFFSEFIGLCKITRPEKIHVLYWDTEVHAEEYTLADIDTMETQISPKGNGGTVVECVPKYIKDHGIDPEAVVIFTDGDLYGGWGNWHHPTLWCICDNEHKQPDNGTVIHIDSGNEW